MRIVYFVNSLDIGGSERVTMRTAEGMRLRGHDVRLWTGFAPGPLAAECAPELQVRGLSEQPDTLKRRYVELWRELRAFRSDVYHGVLGCGLYGAAVARLAGVPAVFTSYGSTWLPGQTISARDRLKTRFLARFCDVCHCKSGGVVETYRDRYGLPPHKLVMVPNFLQVSRFPYRDAAVRADVRAELGLAADAPVCITVARVDGLKGHDDLLHAARTVAGQRPDARFLIVGDGSYRPEAQRLVDELGLGEQVLLVGARRDVPRLLGGADLFVLPTLFEGMPNVLIEAMAAGLPAIMTPAGGVAELLLPGQTGWMVPFKDSETLGATLLDALSDPARLDAFGAAARQRAESCFDEPVVLAQLEALYEQVLAGRGPASRAS